MQEDNVGGGKVLKSLSGISYRLHRLFDSATFAKRERDLNRMTDEELHAEILIYARKAGDLEHFLRKGISA